MIVQRANRVTIWYPLGLGYVVLLEAIFNPGPPIRLGNRYWGGARYFGKRAR